ncbi:MAG: hypothetical protein ACM3QX_07465 [Syntrophomonadaceae bacterium]
MKRSFSFLVLSFLILAFLAAGCSKKDDNPAAPAVVTNPGTPPEVPNVGIKGPSSTSNDPFFLLAKSYFNSLGTFTYYSDMFRNVQAVYSDTGWVRKFLNGSITATLTSTRLADGSISWKLILNGTTDSVTYNNWLALEGVSSADGKSGTWKLFHQNTNLLTGDYSWQKNADSSITATIRDYNASGTIRTRIEATDKADNSGQVLVYFYTSLSFKASWLSDGTGQWWTYDSSGNIRHQGTWS